MNFDEFKEMLHKGIVEFKYKKMDGSIRKAHGTLDPSMWPESKDPNITNLETPKEAKYTRYFDLESNEWRSFINANIVNYEWSGRTYIIARPELCKRPSYISNITCV